MKQTLKDFILDMNHIDRTSEISEDDDLFTRNLLDSLGVVRTISFLEKLSGRSLDLDQAKYEDFASIRSIYQKFLS